MNVQCILGENENSNYNHKDYVQYIQYMFLNSISWVLCARQHFDFLYVSLNLMLSINL